VLHYNRLKRLVMEKQSNLFDPFLSFKEHEVC
jgi:hypothetical protein